MRHIKGIKERISLLAGISVFLLMLSATAATAGSISGYVFNDANQDGVMDAGAGLQGWTVTAQGLYSGSTFYATTDGFGYYTFPNLAFPNLDDDYYTVTETVQLGWTPTNPSNGAYGLFFAGDVTDKNFGNYQSGGGGGGGKAVNDKMTGKGSVLASVGTVKFDFELNCNVDKKPRELEVNWGKNKFHLEGLTSASCSDDSAINPEKPSASFDTLTGAGTGSYNKLSGYTASWTFKDAGEPGKDDTAVIQIYDASGNLVLDTSGKLKDGNIQAHSK